MSQLQTQIQFRALMKAAYQEASELDPILKIPNCDRQTALRHYAFLCFYYEPDEKGRPDYGEYNYIKEEKTK